MNTAFAAIVLVIVGAACAEPGGDGPPSSGNVSIDQLADDPGTFNGKGVRIQSGYYSSFEISALTSGFAESYPPQPVEPMIWVAAGPPEDCLERAQGRAWSERVVATGTFRYDPNNGFGHLGAYPMALEQAKLDCA